MNTEMVLPRAALYALIALCDEALRQGGCPPGIAFDDIEKAREVLGEADRIVIEQE